MEKLMIAIADIVCFSFLMKTENHNTDAVMGFLFRP